MSPEARLQLHLGIRTKTISFFGNMVMTHAVALMCSRFLLPREHMHLLPIHTISSRCFLRLAIGRVTNGLVYEELNCREMLDSMFNDVTN